MCSYNNQLPYRIEASNPFMQMSREELKVELKKLAKKDHALALTVCTLACDYDALCTEIIADILTCMGYQPENGGKNVH